MISLGDKGPGVKQKKKSRGMLDGFGRCRQYPCQAVPGFVTIREYRGRWRQIKKATVPAS